MCWTSSEAGVSGTFVGYGYDAVSVDAVGTSLRTLRQVAAPDLYFTRTEKARDGLLWIEHWKVTLA